MIVCVVLYAGKLKKYFENILNENRNILIKCLILLLAFSQNTQRMPKAFESKFTLTITFENCCSIFYKGLNLLMLWISVSGIVLVSSWLAISKMMSNKGINYKIYCHNNNNYNMYHRMANANICLHFSIINFKHKIIIDSFAY